MGNKKRAIASRTKPSPPPPPVAAASGGGAAALTSLENFQTLATLTPSSITNDSLALSLFDSSSIVESENPNPSIKLLCERALSSLRKGNHTKALRAMKDLSTKHDNDSNPHNLALIYRIQGTVCVKVASIIDDPNAKQRHLRNGIESARKAVSLSPNSVEYAHFYANLLYEAANEGKEYEEVVQECERALAIENPIDPAKESLQEEAQIKISTAEARVSHVQNELRSLIQKSNIASISTWMKNLGNGEEKFRLIPIRRAAEDPMELRIVQTRRPNEIKKATKTPEERRKEIEVRVAAARLLQQKSDLPQSQNEGDKVLDSASGSGQRLGERRKSVNAKKNASSAEKRDWVRLYMNSISVDMQIELSKVRISDLMAHYRSLSKDGLAYEVVSEALTYGEANKSWKFWMCCRCSEKFSEADAFMHHAIHEHMGALLPKMQTVLPQNVSDEWIEMLLNCQWKPLNIVDKQSKSKAPDFLDESYPRSDDEDSKDCFADSYCDEDAWDSSPKKKRSDDNCIVISTPENQEYEKTTDIVWMDCDGKLADTENWPIADDPERAKLLERINLMFQTLIKNKYLASSHLSKVIQFACEELQGLAHGSQLLKYNVYQTPLCLCFLNAPELKKVLKFLQELSQACGLSGYPEKSNNSEDLNLNRRFSVVESLEKLIFNADSSFLLFDERFLNHTVVSDESKTVILSNSYENGEVVFDIHAFLSWIYSGPPSGDSLANWAREKDDKSQQGVAILELLEKEFYNLQGLCERKYEHVGYEEALQAVEELCLQESKKRVDNTEPTCKGYGEVLKKRQDELIQSDKDNNNIAITGNRFELEAVTNILKDSETLKVNHFGYDEASYLGVTSHLCDLEAGEDIDWRAKDKESQIDSCVEVALQRQKEQVSIEALQLSKVDARIMRTLTEMQRYELKLEPVSSFDYRSILVPLVKSFLRVHLEDLAEKDATEKSDAAREAFLAELALDDKKGEKSKDKKKNRKLKSTSGNELYLTQHETTEEISYPDDEEDMDTEFTLGGTFGTLKEQEEEYKRRIELEAEERKLEETLEYQRRIENEAKQKHLATKMAVPEFENLELLDLYPKQELVVYEADETCNNNSKKFKEPLMQSNGFPSISEGMMIPKSIADGAATKIGLPNGGGTSEETVLPIEKRSGRRGRRQKGPTNQSVSSEIVLTRSSDNAKDQASAGDNGTKSLRQLHAEDDDEERFQADLKRAVRQSLDTFQARQRSPLMTRPEKGDVSVLTNDIKLENINEVDVYGTGLKNEVGEYNCFLNVIIQSLWNLRRFRDEFLRRPPSEHVHVGDPCVICALYDIFTALSMASSEAIAPTSLRIALSNLYPDSNFFQEGQMNDASEVLGVIFDCLHRSLITVSGISDKESVGTWDCKNSACIAHSLFGMDIFERMNCYKCGLESRHLKYTSFFHNINASALRTMKVMCPESPFDELLNLVEMNHQLACDQEAGGCGTLNYIHHILSTPPHVFMTVLGWQNTCESVFDIRATLSALSTEMDVSVLYRGLDPKNTHALVSVVCYYGQHYHCFAYSHDKEQWIMYDDNTVKVIGDWNNVISMCERGHLQPQVLFFEAVN